MKTSREESTSRPSVKPFPAEGPCHPSKFFYKPQQDPKDPKQREQNQAPGPPTM